MKPNRYVSKSGPNSNSTISDSQDTLGHSEMQSVELYEKFAKEDITNRRNYNRIVISDSVGHKTTQTCAELDEIATLRQQVVDLERTMVCMEAAARQKNKQADSLRRDNERLTFELKKQQKCNRQIKQQLDDERHFYQNEKQNFCKEMKNHNICKHADANCAKAWDQKHNELQRVQAKLKVENGKLKRELFDKSETTYNLCIKFLRMKHAKDSLKQKLDQLLRDHLQVMAEMMDRFNDVREELNLIVSEKFREPLHLSKIKFLQVVQRNSRLVHENTCLKVQVYQLTQNIEKIKAEAQKTQTINVDARIIEKLAMQEQKRRSKEGHRSSTTLNSTRTEKQLTPSPLSELSWCPFIGDSKISDVSVRYQTNQRTDTHEETRDLEQNVVDLSTIQTQSAPGIFQTAIFQTSPNPNDPYDCENISEHRSISVRDMYTNT